MVGNLLASGLMLTTYPAKIGDTIHVDSDNIHGKIREVNLLYTTIKTDEGKEYVVPNNAIIQGYVRLTRDLTLIEQIPFSEGDSVELSGTNGKYAGTVIRITPKFTTLLDESQSKEHIVPSKSILDGSFTITRNRP